MSPLDRPELKSASSSNPKLPGGQVCVFSLRTKFPKLLLKDPNLLCGKEPQFPKGRKEAIHLHGHPLPCALLLAFGSSHPKSSCYRNYYILGNFGALNSLMLIHLASWVEDCHLWLDGEQETLTIANPPEARYILWPKSIFLTGKNISSKVKVWVLSQLTRPRCQSSLWKRERQKRCLLCPFEEKMSLIFSFLQQTLTTRMVGPL